MAKKTIIEFHYRCDGFEGSSGKDTPEAYGYDNWDSMTEEQKCEAAWNEGCPNFSTWYTETIIEQVLSHENH